MKKVLFSFVAVVALLLVPVSLWLAITRLDGTQMASTAFWAPIGVLVLDALLFYVALGYYSLRVMDRAGVSVVLPMLITMAAWGAMHGMVEERIAAAQAETAAVAVPITGGDRDAHGCIGSAGYTWCAYENRCVRPWELTAEKGLEPSDATFRAYCAVPAK